MERSGVLPLAAGAAKAYDKRMETSPQVSILHRGDMLTVSIGGSWKMGSPLPSQAQEALSAVRTGGASAGPLAPILSEYFDMVPMLGHQVAVLSPTGHLMDTGVFAGLDVWGRACVMTPSGEKALPAEAVSLRAL